MADRINAVTIKSKAFLAVRERADVCRRRKELSKRAVLIRERRIIDGWMQVRMRVRRSY